MSEKDIVEAKKSRDEKEARRTRAAQKAKSKASKLTPCVQLSTIKEKEDAEREIAVMILSS